MAATVLTGNLNTSQTFTYTNNTGGNVRFMTQYFNAGVGASQNYVGTFGFGNGATSGSNWVQWDLFDGYYAGKNISPISTVGNPFPNEIMLADGDRVTWVVQNVTFTSGRKPAYNFLVIPETN